jgi:3',5'-cyclic AMP phosphodiesterase CpdA
MLGFARTWLWLALLLVTSLTVTGSGVALAQEDSTATQERFLSFQPSPIPDRIVLTYDGDPATTQAVTWRTDPSVSTAIAELAVADPDPTFVEDASAVQAATEALITNDGYAAHYHTVVFDGLIPDTEYAYRVGDGINWSEWFHFTTASTEAEPFSLIYVGDAQNDILGLWARTIRAAYSTMPEADLILHAGDLVDYGNYNNEWGEWFEAGGFINSMVASLASPGNHEYFTPDEALSLHWQPQFAFPQNGPSGLEDTVYYLDYQGVRFISLNSNQWAGVDLAPQVEWLDEVLSTNPNRWTVVFFHHPIFSTAEGRDNPEVRDAFLPLFEQYGVDLVLQGHDHTYGRGNLASGATVGTDVGTIFVVSVSGPKMYEVSSENWDQNNAELLVSGSHTQLFQLLSFDNDTLTYESRTVTGDVFDAFTVTKDESGARTVTSMATEGDPAATPTA